MQPLARLHQASQLSCYEAEAAAQIHEEQLQRVELLNGRAAMLGFGIVVISEALTGQGILHQVGLGTLLSQGCIRAQASGWDPQANRGRVAAARAVQTGRPFSPLRPGLPSPIPALMPCPRTCLGAGRTGFQALLPPTKPGSPKNLADALGGVSP